ncbi:PREDICTED: sphingosine kinase 2 isoform X4 [Myotis brandtii]|uniref:sphingosine kinase 2 isoform X4 n=1 Tax=Myotis brandtii TaxID=109478 RepID=UPI0007045809|nr:PREDICTED: sphingosine kinase 2 isoform X4 [Myotis brandtii]XP_014405976.1 PREDICTED: sphingosine kinase 2 isoform X4 [Myotis brandtii]XP_014405977.1 PREDICTED: sphingosine kinase 2 isoform X4 [Myotis brandtii]XP_014405978.1 PREDICTED: sphingosine kinase 2 isoform X4 [Myotis brandtii]XP_014405979.1 PREDICTED: sphingosine kinase 2 isoform X4 [Myotis brandtii]
MDISKQRSVDQRPDQELSWSWGHRLRTVQDRAGAMAPPPLSPLATSTPLLHGEFGSYPARGPRFALTLTPQALHIQRLRPKPEARPRGGLVLLAEVSGCCTLRSRSPSDPAAYLCIYTYPRGRRGGRRRATRTFGADGAATYEENRAEVQRWATVLTCLLRGLQLPGNGGEVPEITSHLLPRPPRLLLLVNPFGGRGLAWQLCKNHVLPMISEAGLSFNLIQTERQNHARELVQGLSLSEWDGIVTVSGDGLLYEVLNGLLDRPDWEEAMKTPVGILPCGSGNALAGAVNQHGGFEQALGIDLLLNCSLLLCRGGCRPLDLLSVTLASGSRCFSFLSVAWGFVSDVDIQSERFRALGSARFTLGTVLGLATLHTYRGRISYLPATVEPASPAPAHGLPRAKSELTLAPVPARTVAHSPLHRSVSDLPLSLPQPALTSPDSPEPLPVLSLNGGGPELARDWGGAGDPPLSPDPLLPSPPGSPRSALLSPITEGAPEMPASSGLLPPTPDGDPVAISTGGPPDHLLPPLGTPLPPGWVTLEGDFVLMLAISPSHLGADLVAVPHARFDDGLVHLCWVRGGISRAALLRLFLAMERGSHFSLGCPQLGYAAARAFRLEPLTPRGVLTVDGEQVEYGPLQAQVHPGLGTLLTGPPGRPGREP